MFVIEVFLYNQNPHSQMVCFRMNPPFNTTAGPLYLEADSVRHFAHAFGLFRCVCLKQMGHAQAEYVGIHDSFSHGTPLADLINFCLGIAILVHLRSPLLGRVISTPAVCPVSSDPESEVARGRPEFAQSLLSHQGCSFRCGGAG